jgi:membrane fusion protein, multidrug efflux system
VTDERLSVKNSPDASLPRGGRWWWIVLVAACIALGLFVLWRSHSARKPAGSQSIASRAIPVTVVAAKKGDLNLYLNGIGSVTPLSTVTLRTRVDGELTSVLFKEGQTVAVGDLLATIDPRPFEVQRAQAEGQLARDQALLENALTDVDRYRLLWQQDSIPKQLLDTQEALVRQYQGAIKTDQGVLDNARLQLLYCRITSPIAGRIGLRFVDAGNIVHAADVNGLVVITQLQPISVIFTLPEDNLPSVLDRLRRGKPLPVDLFNREQTQRLSSGSLITVDNQIDPTTGTVRLKASFENKEDRLFPNQFVNARLLVDVRPGAILIPSAAIQRGPQGVYVYVVKPDYTATIRPIVVEDLQDSLASVKSGIREGELVVVDGAERLREGAKTTDRAAEGPLAGQRGVPKGTQK